MLSTSLRRKVILLLLVAVLAVPWAALAGPPTGHLRAVEANVPVHPDFFGGLWSWLTRLWSETGCSIDPLGHCIPGTRIGRAKTRFQ